VGYFLCKFGIKFRICIKNSHSQPIYLAQAEAFSAHCGFIPSFSEGRAVEGKGGFKAFPFVWRELDKVAAGL
jgi:hypothetical protein